MRLCHAEMGQDQRVRDRERDAAPEWMVAAVDEWADSAWDREATVSVPNAARGLPTTAAHLAISISALNVEQK